MAGSGRTWREVASVQRLRNSRRRSSRGSVGTFQNRLSHERVTTAESVAGATAEPRVRQPSCASLRVQTGLGHLALCAKLLAERGVKHVRTPYRRRQPNGKVERFHQTMAREWAYGLRYRSSRHRAAALPHWLAYYNEHRPHSSLGGLPPISRVHNLCGQDS